MKSAILQLNNVPRKKSVTVTFEELSEWCGRKKPTLVKKWLQDKGIFYTLNADNRPITTELALNDALMRGRKTVPNFNFGAK